jgi:hypothetical protein
MLQNVTHGPAAESDEKGNELQVRQKAGKFLTSSATTVLAPQGGLLQGISFS